MAFDFVGACRCRLEGVVVAVLFLTSRSGGVPLLGPRLDVSCCIQREKVDRVTDCVCEGWGDGVVFWERWLAARIFLA